MKKLLFLLLVLFSIYSCGKKGDTNQIMYGTESSLPPELKGFKLYYVKTSDDFLSSGIYVGLLNDFKTQSINYQSGKTSINIVLLSSENNNFRTIVYKEILVENDSIIVIKK